MKNMDVPKIEMDELWVIIQKKVPRMKDYEDDGPWMWVAFAPGCRLILDFVIGPRKQYVADKLVKSVKKHLSDKIPLFVTDGLNFYKEALLKHFGVLIEFPRTGKRGRPKKPKIFPFDDLKYAQVVKCRGHGGLKYKDERGIECKNTPAREAGIVDSIWTLKELLTFRCFKKSIG